MVQTRKYVGNWEYYIKENNSTVSIERETLNISDDTGRIVQMDTDMLAGTPTPLVRYQYSNHLGTASLELDDSADVLSYEEYFPFGSTSFQSGRTVAEVSLKRYRYTGKERDEETGLYYMGARYYAPGWRDGAQLIHYKVKCPPGAAIISPLVGLVTVPITEIFLIPFINKMT